MEEMWPLKSDTPITHATALAILPLAFRSETFISVSCHPYFLGDGVPA